MKWGDSVYNSRLSREVQFLDHFAFKGDMKDIQERSSSTHSCKGHCEPFWHWQGCLLFNIVHQVFFLLTMASPILQGALMDFFVRLFWLVTCPNQASFRFFFKLPEEVPVGPQGGWSCSITSRWSCAPNRRCREVSLHTWFQGPGSMSHSLRGGWRWQETCTTWTYLRSWWCCFLLSRCHPCTVNWLPGTWNWTPPLTSGLLS